MAALGILHVLGLSTSGFFTGFLSIEGAVFCTRPTIAYLAGAMGLSEYANLRCEEKQNKKPTQTPINTNKNANSKKAFC